jgi:hypothetical protein
MTNLFREVRTMIGLLARIRGLHDLLLFQQTRELQYAHSNPLNRCGKKCFSQGDEDGITIEILKRIGGIQNGVFAEFGVGDGSENNSLILAALGWKGFWVGGQDLAVEVRSPNSRFAYLKEWISLENIIELAERGLAAISCDHLDVISIDLDGNDIYFVEKLLGHFSPKLFIVEYNAKFPPPVEFQIEYDPMHRWASDDYFGASLSSFVALFERFQYSLVCCNSQTGANAFFIDSSLLEHFSDVPRGVDKLYVEPRYHTYIRYGHKSSVRTIENLIND